MLRNVVFLPLAAGRVISVARIGQAFIRLDAVISEMCAPFAGLSSLLYIGLPFSQDQTAYLPSIPPFKPLIAASAPDN